MKTQFSFLSSFDPTFLVCCGNDHLDRADNHTAVYIFRKIKVSSVKQPWSKFDSTTFEI